jgi:LmbE family N-acetylglucosaminyl deacetylase
MYKKRKILVLSPHTDDGEFGCGGSIARFVEEGSEAYYIAFSSCEESVPEGFPKDILIKEVKAATRALGIPQNKLSILNYPVRKFSYHRQEILEELVLVNRQLSPHLVFIPSFNDIHQDHHVIAMEGVRAFKHSTILAYEMPWNNINFSTQAFVALTEQHLNHKLKSLAKYKSQAKRPYAREELVRGLAEIRGVAINVKYAEAFEVIRLII